MDAMVFGIPVVTLGIWILAGMLAGTLFAGGGPVGFIGNVIFGVLGGLVGGWATSTLGINPASFITGVSPEVAAYGGSFITALFGALILLIVLRFIVPRRKR
ncbi:MAG: hypothetical protein MI723_09025 [Caulobacterales bacterium]|nr:hypothetical protein [Caulobacterales bacterium]